MPAITINKRNSIAGEFNNRQWPQLLTINRRESDLIPIRLLLIQNILYFNLIWSRWPLLSATNRSKTSKCRAVSFIGSSQGLRCTPTIKVRLLMAAFLSLFLSLSLSISVSHCFWFLLFHHISFPFGFSFQCLLSLRSIDQFISGFLTFRSA